MPPPPTAAPPPDRGLIASFSLRRNLREVWQRGEGSLAPVDGLRALAFLWVMIFQCFTLPTIHWVSAGNMLRFLDDGALGLAFSGNMGIDVMLVLAGFLAARSLLGELGREGSISTWRFVKRRLLRILPLYAAAMGVHMALDDHQRVVCARGGLANLLFVNNVIGEQLNLDTCLMHTWSMAVVFQLFLLSPLVVRWMAAPRWRLPFGAAAAPPEEAWGIAAPLSLAALATILPAITILRNWQRPALGEWYLTGVYDKTHTRAAPFFFGMAAAYLVHRGVQIPRPARRAVHAAALGAVLVIAYLGAGEHPSRYLVGVIDPHPHRDLFLLLFARQILGLAIAVLLHATLTGEMEPLRRVLSAELWAPLARLSYGAYLVGFAVMVPLYALWAREYAVAASLSDLAPTLFTNGLTAVVGSLSLALGLHLAVEKPILNLR